MINYPIAGDKFGEIMSLNKLSLQDDNPIKAAYEYIKSNDSNFENSIDLI